MNSSAHKWCDVCVLRIKKKYIRELFAVCESSSFLLERGLQISLVPPKLDVPRELTVSEVVERDDCQIVKFEEIVTPTLLQELDGMHCLVTVDVANSLESFEQVELVGWELLDTESRSLGKIVSVEEMPSQLLLEVESESGQSLTLPLVDEFIVDELPENKQIVVDIPHYLLEEWQ